MTAPTHQTLILRSIGTNCLTVAELTERLQLTAEQVGQAAAVLIRRELLERTARGCFQLTQAGTAAQAAKVEITQAMRLPGPPEMTIRMRKSLQQRAWNVMRLRRKFMVHDVVMCAERPEDADPADTVRRYLRALTRAGYARVEGTRAEGRRDSHCKLFALTKDTGPVAPSVIRRGSVLFDHNTGEEVAL